MKTKTELIAQFKLENPTLSFGVNDQVFEMDEAEYEATIESWAEAAYSKELKAQEAEALAPQRQALLDKLGITEEEARLLLGGN